MAPLSAEAKSPQGSSDVGAEAGLFKSKPPRSHNKSRLELEAVPITVEAGEGSTGEESGVKLEAPGMPETLLFVGGGLIPPTGGGGIPRPPQVLLFAALALSLLGMLMLTLMV